MSSFIRSLSVNPNRPCFLMEYGETLMMLDCAMDLRPCLSFLPVSQVFTPALAQIKRWDHGNTFLYTMDDDLLDNEGHLLINGAPEFELPNLQEVEPADLHYILISNFSQIFALPYLINQRNFNGKIFATAPTVQLAKDVFQDMSGYLQTYSTSHKADKWKVKEVLQLLPPPLQTTRPHLWKCLCSMEALEMALKKVEIINFRQTIPLEHSLVITAYSSGFAMGSCNWTIQSPEEKICYLADSSTLNTHLSPIDLEDLKNADAMIISALNMDPARSLAESLERLSKTIMETVREGGNVLIPFSRVDLLIDLLEYLYMYMDHLPTNIPINVVSDTARSMLSLSQVFSEWLNKDYRDKAYLPEEPFIHGEMMRNSRLQIFPSVDGKFSDNFKSPCIVFCSHYSLRFGPGVHLMSQWKSSQKNSVIFTDTEFHFEEILAPYRPFAIKVAYCPMDTRLTPVQVNKIIATTEPKCLIIHERYLTPYDGTVEASEQIVRCPPSTVLSPYKENINVSLPVHYRWIDTVGKAAFLSTLPMTDITSSIIRTEAPHVVDGAQPGQEAKKVLLGRIYGNLTTLDDQYLLESASDGRASPLPEGPTRKYPVLSFEKTDVWKLARFLKKEGFTDIACQCMADGKGGKISSAAFRFTITISNGSTEVATVQPTMETRRKLKHVMEMIRLPKGPVVAGVEKEDASLLTLLPAPEGLMDVVDSSAGPDLSAAMKAIK